MADREIENEPETIKVWVTKYALTEGVFTMEAKIEVGSDDKTKYARGKRYPTDSGYYFLAPKEWHDSMHDAFKRVEEMVAARRKAIAKESVKLDEIQAKLNDARLPMAKCREARDA